MLEDWEALLRHRAERALQKKCTDIAQVFIGLGLAYIIAGAIILQFSWFGGIAVSAGGYILWGFAACVRNFPRLHAWYAARKYKASMPPEEDWNT